MLELEPLLEMKAKEGTSGAGVAFNLADGEAGMTESVSEEVELLERVDLLEPLADPLELLVASLFATL